MWLKIDNPNLNKDELIIIDLREISTFKKTNNYGSGKNTLDIKKEIDRIKSLYNKNFNNFNCREPKEDELIVINANKGYKGIQIIKNDGHYSDYRDIDAMVDIDIIKKKDRVILPYKPRYRTEKQTIHHEIGHWFFDRLGDSIAIKYNKGHRNNIEFYNGHTLINSFEQSSEMAAYYCEEFFNGKHNRSKMPDRYILRRLDAINNKHNKPLKKILMNLINDLKKDV